MAFLKTIIVAFGLLLVTNAYAAEVNPAPNGSTYYFDPVSGNDNLNGLTPTTAWKTYLKFNTTTFQSGDAVLFKAGTTFNVGGWTDSMTIQNSGTPSAHITVSSYGKGAKPILEGMNYTPKTGFILESPTIWKLINTTQSNRWWLDGVEVRPARDKAGLSSSLPWYESEDTLYIFAATNPNGRVTTYGAQNGIRIVNADYIDLSNLEFRGVRYYGIALRNAKHVTIKNCKIANYGNSGIQLSRQKPGMGEITSFNEVSGNTIDSEYALAWVTNQGKFNTNTIEGVNLSENAQDNWIHHNTLINNLHAGIAGSSTTASDAGTFRNIIEYNTIDGNNGFYARGIGLGGMLGHCMRNHIRFNLVKHCNIRSQINGNHNYWYGNIWTKGGISPVFPDRSQHVQFQEFLPTVSRYNIFAFNIVEGAYDVGLVSYSATLKGNEIRNNIMLNNGTGRHTNAQISVEASAPADGQIVTHNDFYSSATSKVVLYREKAYTALEANAFDNFSNNIQADPLFNSEEYTLSKNSPCLSKGILVPDITADYLGSTIKNPPDLGPYQHAQADVGSK